MGKMLTLLVALPLLALAACEDDASVASHNISKAADNFEVMRRIVFYNSWTDTYMMTIEGKCSIEQGSKLAVTCKVGPGTYKKDYLGLSGNVTYFIEQMDPVDVSVYHHRKTWKPQSIIPDIDFRGDADDLGHRDTTD